MRDPLADPAPLIRKVYAYVAYRVGVGAEAEDITSETIERALRYRESFDPRRGDPAAWLIGIARRCIADSRLRPSELDSDDIPERASGDHADEVFDRIELREAVARLNERDRELVALRFGADLTARQIGELLGLKTNAVEVALHRALSTLRAQLDDPGPAEKGERGETQWLTQQPAQHRRRSS
jgi:RNA polymerase sigma factor (sigma-70 family)